MGDPNRRIHRATEERKWVEFNDSHQRDRTAREAAEKAINEKPTPELAVVPMCIDHAPFICDSWARSFMHSDVVRQVPSDIYKVEQRARMDRIIRRSVSLCLVNPKEPSYVSGYVIFEPPKDKTALPILHFILVHSNLQGRGLASQLFNLVRKTKNSDSDLIWSTHWTHPMRRVGQKWNLIYNPYLLELSDGFN